jgi:hypothetical protein
MLNQPKQEKTKRKRYKIPYVQVTIKDNKVVYANNRTVYEDTKNKR